MAATQTHAAQMRYAAETHPAAATSKMPYAAKAHPTPATPSQPPPPPAEVSPPATAAEVSAAASTATAAEGLRSQWRHDGRQRRQQDCANHKSVIFHEYLPELHRNASRLGPSIGAQ